MRSVLCIVGGLVEAILSAAFSANFVETHKPANLFVAVLSGLAVIIFIGLGVITAVRERER